jgi:hypothetical protein
MDDGAARAALQGALEDPDLEPLHPRIRAALGKLTPVSALSGPGARDPDQPTGMQDTENLGVRMSRGAQRAKDEILKPSLSAVNRVADTATFGAVGKAEKGAAALAGRELPADDGLNPWVRGTADAVGMMTGAPKAVGERAAGLADELMGSIVKRRTASGVIPSVSRVIEKGAKGAMTASGTAAATRAGQGLVAGESPDEAGMGAMRAAADPRVLALGGAMGTVGGVAQETARAGKAASPDLQKLDEYGLEPGPIPGRPVIRKDQPVLAQSARRPALGVSDVNPATRGAAARSAGDTIESDLNATEKANNSRFGQLKADVVAREGQNPGDVGPTLQLIDQHLSNVGLNPGTRAHLEALKAQIGQVSMPTRAGTFARALHIDQLRDLADEFGSQGKLAGANDIPLRQAASSLRDALEQAAPGWRDLNKAHSGFMTGLDERRALLGDPERQGAESNPFSREREGAARQARIRQAGEHTATAGGQETDAGDRVERLQALGPAPIHPGPSIDHPDYQATLDVPRLQLAQERMQFSPSAIFSGSGNVGTQLHRIATYGPKRIGYPLARRLGDTSVTSQPIAADALIRAIQGRRKEEENAH